MSTAEVQKRIDEARAIKAQRLAAWIDAESPLRLGINPRGPGGAAQIMRALVGWKREQWAVAARFAKCNPPGPESIKLVLAIYEERAKGQGLAPNLGTPSRGPSRKKIGEVIVLDTSGSIEPRLTTRAAIAMVPVPVSPEEAEGAAADIERLGAALKEIGR